MGFTARTGCFATLVRFGEQWLTLVPAEHIGTKTAVQIRSHAQKFFSKLQREQSANRGPGEGETRLALPASLCELLPLSWCSPSSRLCRVQQSGNQHTPATAQAQANAPLSTQAQREWDRQHRVLPATGLGAPTLSFA